MNQQIRQKYILKTIDKSGNITINQLIQQFNITGMTARRDITELVQQGYLIRTHGGAIKNDPLENMFSFSRRIDRHKEKKIAIGKHAATFVNDNDTIYIDSGTTLIRMCQFLKDKKRLQIITNSLPAASELTNYSNLDVILLGGKVVPERRSIYGSVAVEQVSKYHIKKAFIGTDGVSLKSGLTAYANNESNVSKAISSSSDQVFLLCDSSKIEETSFCSFLALSNIDVFITDKGIEEKTAKDYRAANVNLIIA